MNILEAVKSGKKIQTRDGKKVRILCTDLKNPNHPIVAAITDHTPGTNEEYEGFYCYDKNGYFDSLSKHKCGLDLIVLSEKTTKWFNLYKTYFNEIATSRKILYNSKNEALSEADTKNPNYLGTFAVTLKI